MAKLTMALVGSLGTAVQTASGAALNTVAFGTGESRTANNLLIFWVAVTGTATLPTTPSGWTIAKQQAGTSTSATVYYKIATGGDAAPTIAAITSGVIAGQLGEFSGTTTTGVIVDKTGGAASTTSPATATFTAADKFQPDFWVAAGADFRSASRSPNDTWTGTNITAVAAGNNNGTSSANHYSFAYDLDTSANASADTAVLTASVTTSLTGLAVAAASFITATIGSAQAQADIKATSNGFGQARAVLPPTTFGQAITIINGSAVLPFTDTFTRSVTDGMGTSDNGSSWTITAGTAADFDVNGSELTVITAAGVKYSHLKTTLVGTARGYEFLVKLKIDKLPASNTVFFNLYEGGTTSLLFEGTEVTGITIGISPTSISLANTYWAGYQSSFATPIAVSANTYYWVKVHLLLAAGNGYNFKSKIWNASTGEPGWMDSFANPLPSVPNSVAGHPIIQINGSSDVNAPFTWTVDSLHIETAFPVQSGQAQARIKKTVQGFGQAQAYQNTRYLYDDYIRVVGSGIGFSTNRTAYGVITGSWDVNNVAHSAIAAGSNASFVAATVNQNRASSLQFAVSSFDQGGTIAVRANTTLSSVLNAGWGAKLTVDSSGNGVLSLEKDATTLASTSIGAFPVDVAVILKLYTFEQGGSTYLRAAFWDPNSVPESGAITVSASSASTISNQFMGVAATMSASNSNPVDVNIIFMEVDILGLSFGQAQAKITSGNFGSGQAQVDIKTIGQGYGQALALIPNWFNAQAVGLVNGSFFLPFSDTFTRTVGADSGLGTSDNTDTWSLYTGNNTGVSVNGSSALFSASTSKSYRLKSTLIKGNQGLEISCKIRINAIPSSNGDGITIAAHQDATLQQTGITIVFESTGVLDYNMQVRNNGLSGSTSFAINTDYIVKYHAIKSTAFTFQVKSKIWDATTTEPGWQDIRSIPAVAKDFNAALIGTPYIRYEGGSGASTTISLDYINIVEAWQSNSGQAQADIKSQGRGLGQAQSDIKATNNGFGQAQADIKSVNNGSGQANSDIKTQNRGYGQASTAIYILVRSAQDDFNRTVSSGLGFADIGGPWTVISSTGVTVSVNGTEAVFGNITIPNSSSTYILTKTINEDAEGEIVFRKDLSGSSYNDPISSSITFRSTNSGTTGYRVRLRILTDNSSVIEILRGATLISTTALSLTDSASTSYHLKARVFGVPGRIQAKAWIDGNTEQSSWDVDFQDNDSTYTSGSPRLISAIGSGTPSGTLNIYYDSFRFEALNFPFAQAQAYIRLYAGYGQAQAAIDHGGHGLAAGLVNGTYFAPFNDTFNRSVATGSGLGTSDNGDTWTLESGTNTNVGVNGSKASLKLESTAKIYGLEQTLINPPQGIQIKFKISEDAITNTTISSIRIGIERSKLNVTPGAEVLFTVDSSSNYSLAPQFNVTSTNPISGSFTTNTEYQVLIHIIPVSNNKFATASKIWIVGNTEPGWISDIQNTSALSYSRDDLRGHPAIRVSAPTASNITALIDDINIEFAWLARSGQAQADIKSTSTKFGQTQALITHNIFTLHDTFTRTIATNSGWGTADSGTPWVGFPFNDGYGVNGSQGYLDSNYEPGVQANTYILTRSISANFQFKIPDFESITFRWNVGSANLNGYSIVFIGVGTNLSVEVRDFDGSTTLYNESTWLTNFDNTSFYQVELESFVSNPDQEFNWTNSYIRWRVYKVGDPIPAWSFEGGTPLTPLPSNTPIFGYVSLGSVLGDGTLVLFDNVNVEPLIPYGNGQAQADIKTTNRGFGQTQADIKAIGYGLGQAQAKILSGITVGYGQAQADIKQTYNQYGQTQADIKALGNGFGQSQADVKATSNGFGQAQSDIKQTYFAEAQAQADIKQVGYGEAQAQADIKAVGYGSGQCQADIKTTNRGFGQCQADIKQTYYQPAQAQSDIKAARNGFGQCQAYIYTPQIARPVADISNDGWIRVVI